LIGEPDLSIITFILIKGCIAGGVRKSDRIRKSTATRLKACSEETSGLLNLAYAQQIRFRNLHINMAWQFT
jgi:hypothetical protein